MTIQATRNRELEEKLRVLVNKVVIPAAQMKIRKEILTVGELGQIKERLYSEVGDDELDFARAFDFNGRYNMVELAKIRNVGERRIALDMAVEAGFLAEADYRRYVRQLDSDSTIRPSVMLHYSEGSLYRNGVLIGTVQERSDPTKMQTVLQAFQDQNWPTSIAAPSSWDDEKVTNACRQLRDRFQGHISFHESDGGKSIRLNTVNDDREVTPN